MEENCPAYVVLTSDVSRIQWNFDFCCSMSEVKMTHHLRFEDLIATKTSRPDLSGEIAKHAMMAQKDFARFVLMSQGYRRSADGLVDVALDDWDEKDILIYPILILYRQAIELNLKHIINGYGRHVGVCPVWNSHDFEVLLPRFRAVLEGVGAKNRDETDERACCVVAQIGHVDPNSFSHLDPCDMGGNPIPLFQKRTDLEILKRTMDGVFGYLARMEGVLYERLGAPGCSRN